MTVNDNLILERETLSKSRTLVEGLSQIKRYTGETFVIKVSDAAMENQEVAESFAYDMVLLKEAGINPVIVHGGGVVLDNIMEKLGLKSKVIEGIQVIDAETIEYVEMVLSGKVNKKLVSLINKLGGSAIGISGKDGNLVEARKLKKGVTSSHDNVQKIVDFGFVGEPTMVNPDILVMLEESDIIPVISPIANGEYGETFNINSDILAGILASSLAAAKLILLHDGEGVIDNDGNLITEITLSQAEGLIKSGAVTGKLLSKLETCISSMVHHTDSAHIIDGRIPHSVLLEVFTDEGIGTAFMLG